jgi:hypothetical protein
MQVTYSINALDNLFTALDSAQSFYSSAKVATLKAQFAVKDAYFAHMPKVIKAVRFTLYWMPRIAGLWIYTVSMIGLFIFYCGMKAYESGQMFRSQFNEGYDFGCDWGDFCPLACGISCELPIAPSTVDPMVLDVSTISESSDSTELTDPVYVWSMNDKLIDLRNACKNSLKGYSRKNKQQCLEHLSTLPHLSVEL